MTKRISELNLFFSTPVWVSKTPDFEKVNIKIFAYIKKLEKQNPEGIQKSNLRGWHSPDFNMQDSEPKEFFNSIAASINEALIDMGWDLKDQKAKITSMWSIINKSEATNARHIHGNNFISAAYYVKAPENCGNIVFHDPRSEPSYYHPKISTPNKLNTNVVTIKPEEGLLVLFPSYLHHSVDINRSNEERIVISFNLNLI
jgi:uncharacterized protein (TIGR02466 family)